MCDDVGNFCQRFSGVFGSELIAGAYLSQIGLLIFFLLKESKIFHEIHFYKIIPNIFILFLFIFIIFTEKEMHY